MRVSRNLSQGTIWSLQGGAVERNLSPQPGRRCVGGVTCETGNMLVRWVFVDTFFLSHHVVCFFFGWYMVESCGLCGSVWLVFVCKKKSHLLKMWRLSFSNWNTNKRSPKCMGETICQKDHLAKRARQPAGRACGWFLAGYPLWKEPFFFEVTIRQTAAGKTSSILKACKNKNRDEKKSLI